MERGRQPGQLVVLGADGKERPDKWEEFVGWWEGGVGAVEGVDQGGNVVGGGGGPDVPVQAGEHYHLPFLGGETYI